MTLTITSLSGIPLIKPGDDLGKIILKSPTFASMTIENGDILVLAQKIVSKAEGRLVNLSSIHPSSKAISIARESGKDPRFIDLVLQESNEVMRVRAGTVIVEHRLGFVCANAGIDHSNVNGEGGEQEDWFLLLPINPDGSSKNIRDTIQNETGKKIGVMVIDSHGRAWRQGVVGCCIGLSGIPSIIDMRGKSDLFGYQLKVTLIAVADELAAAASLVMGQAAEGTPVVHVRGFPYKLSEGSFGDLLRPKYLDLFR